VSIVEKLKQLETTLDNYNNLSSRLRTTTGPNYKSLNELKEKLAEELNEIEERIFKDSYIQIPKISPYAFLEFTIRKDSVREKLKELDTIVTGLEESLVLVKEVFVEAYILLMKIGRGKLHKAEFPLDDITVKVKRQLAEFPFDYSVIISVIKDDTIIGEAWLELEADNSEIYRGLREATDSGSLSMLGGSLSKEEFEKELLERVPRWLAKAKETE
jgi:hypothetical protein